MKRKIVSVVFLLLICFASCSFINKRDGEPTKAKFLLEVLQSVVNQLYYTDVEIDDQYSEKVYQTYISSLDSQKRYFVQSDIDEFEAYKTRLDDDMKAFNASFFELSYQRILERIEQVNAYQQEIFKTPFDFSKEEEINTDFDNLPFAQNLDELKERWRKILKFSTLSSLLIKEKEEQTKAEKDSKYQKKSLEELVQEATESTQKMFQDLYLHYKDMLKEEWLGIYIDSYAKSFDPHTNYFTPDLKERFETGMSGKFEGIGAQLQKNVDGLKITSVILGGPVWKQKSLEVGDVIMKVAQSDQEPVDVIGMRMEDAIKLIKGPKRTEVRLTVKRVAGNIEVVSIIRDVVELEETFAKSVLVKDAEKTFGVIKLPKFYIDFENPKEGRNSDTDMEKEILALKRNNVDGLIIDLRDNGGGSLRTVVNIVGMFIQKGPVVQVRSEKGRIRVLEDKDSSILWDKPVVVLINELSASASEILAAALQDYNRAIVIGSNQSFGKGTVQNVVDLDRVVRSSSFGKLGATKVTMEKFYRVNGGSTQLEGVKSDIVLPDKYKYSKVGEREMDFPMKWDEIKPTEYMIWTEKEDFVEAIENSNLRVKNNPYFELIDQNARWIEAQRNQNIYSLNYQKYKEETEKEEEFAQKFKEISNYKSRLKFVSLPEEEELVKTNDDLKLRRDRWHETLQKDLYIEESVKVLGDLVK